MMFKKFGRSKFVQMRFKNVTKEMMNLQFLVHWKLQTYIDWFSSWKSSLSQDMLSKGRF